MTQEQKRLLLIDLCARLPYGVRMNVIRSNVTEVATYISPLSEEIWVNDAGAYVDVEEIRPYLRPMSSMTEKEYNSVDWEGCRHVVYYDKNGFRFVKNDSFTIPVLDYLNARHFDFRYLIEKGLALEAPEGMYKTE